MASQNGHATTVQALIDGGAQVDLQNAVRYSSELDLMLLLISYDTIYAMNQT